MKVLIILLPLSALLILAGCDDRNTGTRGAGPASPEESQVTHPDVHPPQTNQPMTNNLAAPGAGTPTNTPASP